MKTRGIIFLGVLAGIAATAVADDWPHGLGPEHALTWREEGVATGRPEDGWKVAWRAKTGWGYSGPAVADGKVYLTDYVITTGEVMNKPSARVKLTGSERVRCFDAVTGKELWAHAEDRDYDLSYPGGPRAVPTIADGKVYVLGAMGHLACHDAGSGAVVWKRDFVKDYNATVPIWGFSAHPLVDGDTVYCIAGGPGSVAVAFDKETGEEKWKALSAAEQGYCPPTIINYAKTTQLMIWHPESLNSLNPETGALYWSIPLKPSYGMAIMAPRRSGDKLFASGIGSVGALMKLEDSEPSATIIWRGTPKTAVYCANSTPYILGDAIYGSDIRSSSLVAVRMKDGERLWSTRVPTVGEDGPERAGHGTAFLVYHKGNKQFWIFSETGDLILAELSPEKYTEIARQHVLEPTNEAFGRKVVWSMPAFAMKSAFLRNDKELVRVDLAK
ncbi:MAG: PQQ-like beta-propeller repeat protein [Akkermansiaceae bacterium]|nr:PQQ-like beta-propeller repeat protein [Akkermansiaceae bacterium]